MIALLAAVATAISDARPPIRFQGTAEARVHFVQPEAIDVVCEAISALPPGPAYVIQACTKPGPTPQVWLPNPCFFPDSDKFAHLACHELGHVNGWSDAHER